MKKLLTAVALGALVGMSGHTTFAGETREVTIAIDNWANYPFGCYEFTIGARSNANPSYWGRILAIDYGFTKLSPAEFEAQPLREFEMLGRLSIGKDYGFKHDGGYKGAMVMSPLKIKAPVGMNVVYQLEVERVTEGDGNCTPMNHNPQDPTHLVRTRAVVSEN